jgi:flavin reductase (DIM6/NTAB) family NADH-FMN oxidoreductase RutF
VTGAPATGALAEYAGDVDALRQVFAAYPSGLAAIGAGFDGEPELMIASSFTVGVSYDPPLCSVAIQNSSTTWPRLRVADRVGVSALATGHADSVRKLGSRRSRGRLDGLDVTVADSGALFIDGAAVQLECSIEHEIAAGDHRIVLLRVHAMAVADDDAPLVLHRGGLHEARRLAVLGG